MCFDESPPTCQCENGDKKVNKQVKGLKFCTYWLFSSDIMAGKGLITWGTEQSPNWTKMVELMPATCILINPLPINPFTEKSK